MATYLDTVTELETQALDAFTNVQEPVVDIVRKVADFVGGRLPEDRPSLPFSDQLPTVSELVESQFAFAQKVLDANHRFVKAIVDAAGPILGEQPVAKPRAAKKVAAA